MVERRMWLSQSPLRQFKQLPDKIARMLERKDIPWERYYDLKVGPTFRACTMHSFLGRTFLPQCAHLFSLSTACLFRPHSFLFTCALCFMVANSRLTSASL
jgi:hypothetical protein